MKKILFPALGIPVAAVLVWLDQITKIWAVGELQGKGTIQVIGDFFLFHFAKNRGAFLSLGNNLPEFVWYIGMVILPLAALTAFTLYLFRKHRENLKMWILWGLVMAGGIGNLIDRILLGEVTDFMVLDSTLRFTLPWNGNTLALMSGVFNVADLYIVLAVIFVVFFNPFEKKKS